ncbi:MAG: carbon monoxide dehydrogenase subunit G [Pseudomonadales bacterium]|nr:carbon monoxide dehydrogenase subunit G [Pseudomonadales bacterium]MBO6565560.1 carbon monoxide dehydrogenase subunit G [Pseudomonadales bacterium]MBO6595168.1 carbon monoxide dehydrogenase subunit G [Pseudomonadales bacterium]MBO6701674.1 carbon monoxide dehydrogenase subunit G [Pseudomonadales bacterium]MBO6821273.1 carbon monoxide dehydrogenase subunit G [Pseudomonadales bacterium]
MELSQRVRIPVSTEQVWRALNDPSVLQQCLPGCQLFKSTGDNEFEVAVQAKVGPVKATFEGAVELSDVYPPVSYKISGSGKGGVAGFAKGAADVSLEATEDGGGTLMSYKVSASVGGKLAQVGSRLVTGAARKMADDFFSNFVRLLSGDGNMQVDIETLET